MQKRLQLKNDTFLHIVILIGSLTLATLFWAPESPRLSPTLVNEYRTITTDPTETYTCTDTDGALGLKSIYEKGIVTREQRVGLLGIKNRKGGGVDRCLGPNTVVEYSCNDEASSLSFLFTCPPGYYCDSARAACRR